MTAIQSTAWNRPSIISYPAGVCIHEFSAKTRAIDFYRRAFGLDVADRFVFDDFTLVYLRNPEAHFEVELTVNHGRTKPYDHGDSYGHLAVVVDDLAAEHVRLANEGFVPNPIKEMGARRGIDGALLLRAGPGRL
jgi:lactoylglutathione lyase